MSKHNFCPACNAIKTGIKSRVAFKHNCGKDEIEFNDNTPMPFGKHKGEAMANVPGGYLLHLYDSGIAKGNLRKYITENIGVLNTEAAREAEAFRNAKK